jgi:transposase
MVRVHSAIEGGGLAMVEKPGVEAVVREIGRRTRRKFSSEEKIRIVLKGLRGEMSIAELCRKEGIHENVYYKWSKDFLEAGKKRLQGDTARDETSSDVVDIKTENDQLKALIAELSLMNQTLTSWGICNDVPS